MPHDIALSASARDILGRRFSGRRVPVTPETVGAYRESATAGLAEPVSGFPAGPEAHFRLAQAARDRRDEPADPSSRPISPDDANEDPIADFYGPVEYGWTRAGYETRSALKKWSEATEAGE